MTIKEISEGIKLKEKILEKFFYIAIGILFFVLRIPALFQPYHQDEYKWAMAVGFEDFWSASIPHPPLTRFLYVLVSHLFGNDYLRLMPLMVSFITLCLIFFFVKRYYGKVSGYIAAFLFAVIPYSVLGSLQIDIDGAVLPLFSMITFFGYFLFRESGFKSKKYIGIIFLGIIGGFLSKLSFVIVPAVCVAHFIFEKYFLGLQDEKRKVFMRKALLGLLGAVCILPLVFWLSDHVFIFRYVKNFTHLSGRNYFELFFLTSKAVIYLSPLLVLAPFLSLKSWQKVSLWYFFAIASILFYAVVFDFTHRTLDRYWMILVLPLVIIASVNLSDLFFSFKKRDFKIIFLTLVTTGICGYFIFSLQHEVLPLNPKTAFIHALLSLHLNILIPLSGGSGPLGFYVSLLGVAFFWCVSLLGLGFFFLSKTFEKRNIVIFLLSVSFVYSLCITCEYLYGYFYGSSSRVLSSLLQNVKERGEVSSVMDYNDSGAYELIQMQKYSKRFYADPSFVDSNKEKFSSFKGYFMVLDFPRISKDSFYSKYLSTCKINQKVSDKYIDGYVYDCRETSVLN